MIDGYKDVERFTNFTVRFIIKVFGSVFSGSIRYDLVKAGDDPCKKRKKSIYIYVYIYVYIYIYMYYVFSPSNRTVVLRHHVTLFAFQMIIKLKRRISH